MKLQTVQKANELIAEITALENHLADVKKQVVMIDNENFKEFRVKFCSAVLGFQHNYTDLLDTFFNGSEFLTLYIIRVESHLKKLEAELEGLQDEI